MLTLALLACRRDDPPPGTSPTEPPVTPGAPLPLEERTALVEHLLDPPVDAALPAGVGVLWVAGAARAVTTGDGATFPLGDGPPPDDVADVQGQVFALVDGAVTAWVGGALVDAGFDLPPARALHAEGDALWVETGRGVFRWRAGELAELTVDGASADARVAAGASWTGARAAWLAIGDRVHGFATAADTVEGFETRAFERPVDAVAVVDGALLVAEGGRLWRRDGVGWAQVSLDERVADLFGGPGGAWLRTDAGLRLWRGDALWAPEGLPDGDGRWLADELGRLLVRTAAGVDRWTLHRPIRLLGLAAGDHLDVARTVEVVLTAPDDAGEVAAEVRPQVGDPVAVAVDAGRLHLDPAALPTGPATLWLTASYPDQEAALSVPFTVELVGDVTWERHVEPIHAARCASCHEDSANTVLDGPESWEALFDDILANVSSGAMPLVGDPLTAAQVELIEAWAAGGFR